MTLCELTLREAAYRIRDGAVSSESYCRALLERCEAVQSLNAFIALDAEKLLDSALAADQMRQRGDTLGPLHGVPLAIKDAIDVAGLPTTAGTPGLRDNVASRAAPIVQRLFDAGALMLGKTNLPELCYAITNNNEFTGASRNPYDDGLSPGGSSGGTAVAVAARMAPAGIGTDTSGSIRIPAAFCGVVGFRASTGRYPSAGVVPMNHSRDALGFLGRSVNDVALLDEVCTGAGPLRQVKAGGVRIGVPRDYFFAGADSRIIHAVEAELARLRDLGFELVEAEPPDFAELRSETTGPIMISEFAADVQRYLDEREVGISFDDVAGAVASPYVRSAIDQLMAAAGPEAARRYERAIDEVIPRHRAAYVAYLRDNSLAAMAFPTTPLMPGPVGENEAVAMNGERVSLWRTMRNAIPATMLGAPGLTYPVGLTTEGLPVGLEIDGLPGGDRELLSVGLTLQTSAPPLPPPQVLKTSRDGRASST